MKRLLVVLAVLAIPMSLVAVRYGPVGWDWFVADKSCIGCHRQSNDQLVGQWLGSAHFSAGVDCEACHGSDHDAMFAAQGDVSSKVCAECHEAEYAEFSRSGHPHAEEAARKSGRFLAAQGAMQRRGCMTCHEIGRSYPDGGQGSCNYCHTGHRFSAEEARTPEACEVCHIGPDHPQVEAWRASKHGQVFHTMGDEESAPTCVTCHMGGAAGHDTTRNLTLGHVGPGAVMAGTPTAVPMRVVTPEAFEASRGSMLEVCRRCHSAGFARRALADADEIKVQADGLVAEAAQIIRGLHDEGLLAPMPADRPPHPNAGHVLVLGGDQLYSDTSSVEQKFFEMAKFNHAATFKGAYHGSPDHTHWLGYARLQADLTAIRDEARRLRGGRLAAAPEVPAAEVPPGSPASAAPSSDVPEAP